MYGEGEFEGYDSSAAQEKIEGLYVHLETNSISNGMIQRNDVTRTYKRTGSPTVSISCITHFRSNAFASTILKIFCTLMDADVEQKISDACIALANLFA